jgi:hypothetical protein
VQGVRRPAGDVDGAAGRNQRLARSPVRRTRAAIPPAASVRGTGSTSRPLEVEDGEKILNGRGHRSSRLAQFGHAARWRSPVGARYHTRLIRRVKRSDRIAFGPSG